MVALMLGLDRLHLNIHSGALRAPIGAHVKELAGYARKALAAAPRLQPVCKTCGGTVSRWTPGRPGGRLGVVGCGAQRWALHSVYEATAICADCDVECSYAMKPVTQAP